MAFSEGEPAPWFKAATPSNPEFTFDSTAGRFILLAFLPTNPAQAIQGLKAMAANQPLFNDAKLSAFGVIRAPSLGAGLKDMSGLRWFLDYDGALFREFGLVDAAGADIPMWVVLDPALRFWKWAPMAQTEAVFAFLKTLPDVDQHAATTLHAPVLIAPRVLEPELCDELIALHQESGGTFTGVMRDIGGRTELVMDELKKRRDVTVTDPGLLARLRERLEDRLIPMLERSMGFKATHIERYVISCYDAADGGVFHAHRDTVTMGTAHRRFACSLNLNADFEGGDLRFPEFGRRTYRPPLGGAVVFSGALLHEATRVKQGRRYAFLPFLHDDEGQAVLDAYNRRLEAAS